MSRWQLSDQTTPIAVCPEGGCACSMIVMPGDLGKGLAAQRGRQDAPVSGEPVSPSPVPAADHPSPWPGAAAVSMEPWKRLAGNVQRTKSPSFPPGVGGLSRSVQGRDVGEKGVLYPISADLPGVLWWARQGLNL